MSFQAPGVQVAVGAVVDVVEVAVVEEVVADCEV